MKTSKSEILKKAHKMANGAIRNGHFNGKYRLALSWAIKKAYEQRPLSLVEKCNRMINTTCAKPRYEKSFWSVVNYLIQNGYEDKVDAGYVWSKYLDLTEHESVDITIQEYIKKAA